ncbi:uncharacterized protein [Gossypium hirsutum]|uniref:Tf2-1-like SH3-like domain-containing protein n=1 Tax=Gossypium hirsutum TaxID=3635 RepID=A0ABM3BWC5_GOSHI|nr:uncharacterized protein LOC121230518 [Gossypium hirsutum]
MGLKREVTDFIAYFLTCQQVNTKHQLPFGLLQLVKIPLWKWERVTIDFKLAKLYISEIVRLHEILEDMLQSSVIDFRGSWEDYLSLAEFAYNNSFQSNNQMAPYEALYGHKCRTPLCWTELDLKRREIEYSMGDLVFLKDSPWKKILRFDHKGKLSPRFLAPYRILKRVGPVGYQLKLPPELDSPSKPRGNLRTQCVNSILICFDQNGPTGLVVRWSVSLLEVLCSNLCASETANIFALLACKVSVERKL